MENICTGAKKIIFGVVDYILNVAKACTEAVVSLVGKLAGKAGGCLCKRMRGTVSAHRQGVLLGVAAVTCVASVVSMAAYLLGRRK